jgi:hypothetical protein
MIKQATSNLQKFFIESNSKLINLSSQESFYSEKSNDSNITSKESKKQKSINSKNSKNSKTKTVKTELEHFLLRKKGEIETYSLNPQLGHIFQAKKRTIKIFKNNQPLQLLNVELDLGCETKQEESELFSEMVQEIMNVSMESFEEDNSILHYTNSKKDQIANSSYSVSRRLSKLLQTNTSKRKRLNNDDFGVLMNLKKKSRTSLKNTKNKKENFTKKSNFMFPAMVQSQEESRSQSKDKNKNVEKSKEKNNLEMERGSRYTSSVNLSLDSEFKPKWRISCIISVNQYLMVGLFNLDQILIYKMTNNGKYDFFGKIELKISKGFHKVIDMDYNSNSSYLSIVYSKFNLNNITNQNLQPGRASLIIEYGIINLTMLDAIKYSSKTNKFKSPSENSINGEFIRDPL